MKILWLVNFRMPIIDEILGENTNFFGGGWLTGLIEKIIKDDKNNIIICYPEFDSSKMVTGEKGNVKFYGFPINAKKNRMGTLKTEKITSIFEKILNDNKPDVIHLHGTEFQFSYAMSMACKNTGNIKKTVASIQGMVSVYANHYYGNLPYDKQIIPSIKEIIRRESINDGCRAFVKRGIYEKKTISNLENVIGRTRWDYINCKIINKDINYFYGNETLRDSFYIGEWDYKNCIKHSIFVTQAGTVLKGFHKIVLALEIVKKFYPDTKIYVAGPKITQANWLRIGGYGKYIKKLILERNLNDNIYFTGSIDENKIKEQMLNANIFVSASSIENSPNSLGEAMLLGVPCISSDVGGVTDMMTHNVEGYVFPSDSVDMLVYYILKIFEEKENAKDISNAARIKARKTHNPDNNYLELLSVYEKISKNYK